MADNEHMPSRPAHDQASDSDNEIFDFLNHCNKIQLTSMMILPRGAPSADMSKKTLVVIVFEEFDKEFLNENRKKVLQS